MLANGASINRYNAKHENLLHLSISHPNAENICEHLLKNGASANLANTINETPLHIAAKHQKNRICKFLIDHGALVNEMSDKLEIPLHIAAKTKNGELCQLLIDSGADIYQKTKDNKTLLDTMTEVSNFQLYRNLPGNLLFKVSINDCNGKTPKEYFLRSNNHSEFNLASKTYYPVCLHMAILSKNLSICQKLLIIKNQKHKSLICSEDQYLCWLFWLGKRGYLYDKDDNDHLGAHSTNENMSYESCWTFTDKATISFDSTGDLKWTAIHFAAVAGDCEVLRFLFRENVPGAYHKNNENQTCLHIAALNGRVGISKCLIEGYDFDLDINVADERK